MKVFDYSLYEKSGNETYDIFNAIRKCKQEKYDKIVFPKSTYVLDATFSEQRNLSISNHGLNGPKRIAFLIDEMENFEMDFNGSTIFSEDVLIPISVLNSKNITVKNAVIENPKNNVLDMKVIDTGSNWAKLSILGDKGNFFFENGKVWATYGREYQYIKQDVVMEVNSTTGEIEYGTGDNRFGNNDGVYYELIDNNTVVVKDIDNIPKIGNIIVTNAYCRCAAGVFIHNSENVVFENITVNSCLGMGLIAQFSKNITLRSFSTVKKQGTYHTCGADATHFVCCSGLVKVENCTFESQLDDALNIHGMFVKTIQKLNCNELLLKEMHCQATGLPVFNIGDKVEAVDKLSLLPYKSMTVADVEYLNDETLKVKFNENVDDIKIEDNIENITKNADLLFKNNVVKNNRGRGMLIATKGKVEIVDNYFHTSGDAILFESDDKWWFEAGGTNDVTIKRNVFDTCKYATWGNAVIEFVKREKEENDKYYHNNICIVSNEFKLYDNNVAILDNIKNVTFNDNIIDGKAHIKVSHVGNADIQSDNVELNNLQ